jgi:hypothetical protein
MKKLVLPLVCFIILAFVSSTSGFIFVRGKPPAAGGVSPDWSYGFESADACSNHFDTVNVAPECDDTAHPNTGTYDMLLRSGSTDSVEKEFTASKTEVWFYGTTYLDAADLSTTTRRIFDFYDGTSGSNNQSFRIGTKDSTGLKYYVYDWINTTYYYGSTAPSGQTQIEWRIYIKSDNSTGILRVAINTGGGWSTEINETSLDSCASATCNHYLVEIGNNGGTNLPESWYVDDLEIYYSNPGWSW